MLETGKILEYLELIQLAMQGRSVNATSQALGIPLATFQRYASGERIPDCWNGLKIVQAAGVSLDTGFLCLAEAQRKYNQRRPGKSHQ